VWQCAQQCATVRQLVCRIVRGSVQQCGIVWQCAWQCATVHGGVRQSYAVMWQCNSVYGSAVVCGRAPSSVGYVVRATMCGCLCLINGLGCF
jgi:hypothetical protein